MAGTVGFIGLGNMGGPMARAPAAKFAKPGPPSPRTRYLPPGATGSGSREERDLMRRLRELLPELNEQTIMERALARLLLDTDA
jgi:hypothetical protein